MKLKLKPCVAIASIVLAGFTVLACGGNDVIPQPVVTSVTISPDAVDVRRGDTQQFSAEVVGQNNPPSGVIWDLDGHTDDAGTFISTTGLLTVSENEEADEILVFAMSAFDDEMGAVAVVTVLDRAGVAVSPAIVDVERGGTQQFTAALAEGGSASDTFNWTVEGSTVGTETSIDQAGLLTVSANEGAQTLTVVATSAQDATMSGTATVTVTIPGHSLAARLANLRAATTDGVRYEIDIIEDEDISPIQAALPTGRTNLTIVLNGGDEEREIRLSANGTLFVIGAGITLELGENVTLVGRSADGNGDADNNNHLVRVNDGGTLVMNDGARIIGNTNSTTGVLSIPGGGVRVNTSGTFTMNGGEISGNSAGVDGGGVSVGGTFNMLGGEIFDNTARDGAGVHIDTNGTFTLDGGEVFENTASRSGGGVIVSLNGTFTMEDGEISGNTANTGGGVNLSGLGSSFTMRGGYIIDNNANQDGGGIAVTSGTVVIHEGEISGNTGRDGGGLFFSTTGSGNATMHNAIITDNTATGSGGGVYFAGTGRTLDINGGEISENSAANGGGVFILSGTINIRGAYIVDNEATGNGGGIRSSSGTVNMFDGEIFGNTANVGGGVSNSQNFNMRGGIIAGNAATTSGGAVHNTSTFRISDGRIHGRAARPEGLRNTAGDSGAVLFNTTGAGGGTAQRGTFNAAGAFTLVGTLVTHDFAIVVENGSLVYDGTEDNPIPLDGDPTIAVRSFWTNGAISTATLDRELWFAFHVSEQDITQGTTFNIWTNGAGTSAGDGSKTLAVSVSAFNPDETSIFENQTNLWGTPREIRPVAGQSGTMRIRVTPTTSGQTGTFAIAYSTHTTRPAVPVRLSWNDWADGEITAGGAAIQWFSFEATAGTTYRVWWNELAPNGDGDKTLNVTINAFNPNGMPTPGFSGTGNGWATPQTITPTQSGTIRLAITPATSGQTGTFALVYGTETTRPVIPTGLVENFWTTGEITATVGELWFSFQATAGIIHRIWLNDSHQGNNNKTLDVAMDVFNPDMTSIATRHDSAWETALMFTPSQSGTIRIRVTSWTAGQTGTFGIAYTVGAINITRPAVPMRISPLGWVNHEITSTTPNGELWFYFEAVAGTTYHVWSNTTWQGDTSKTLDAVVDAFNPDGTTIFSGAHSMWNTPRVITPTQSGNITLRVHPFAGAGTGTFGIVFDTSATRPPVQVTLREDIWQDAQVTTSGDTRWFNMRVTAGNTYRIWWSDQGQGGEGMTMDIQLTAFNPDGTTIFSSVNHGWTTPQTFTPTQSGIVRLHAGPQGVLFNRTGTFRIVYSTSVERPIRP